ncbi:MAG: hypothetical protein FWG02_05190 [Holophagaceae bacterium]|nr:hypothetical protein [Holophagaceae bacterium]
MDAPPRKASNRIPPKPDRILPAKRPEPPKAALEKFLKDNLPVKSKELLDEILLDPYSLLALKDVAEKFRDRLVVKTEVYGSDNHFVGEVQHATNFRDWCVIGDGAKIMQSNELARIFGSISASLKNIADNLSKNIHPIYYADKSYWDVIEESGLPYNPVIRSFRGPNPTVMKKCGQSPFLLFYRLAELFGQKATLEADRAKEDGKTPAKNMWTAQHFLYDELDRVVQSYNQPKERTHEIARCIYHWAVGSEPSAGWGKSLRDALRNDVERDALIWFAGDMAIGESICFKATKLYRAKMRPTKSRKAIYQSAIKRISLVLRHLCGDFQ